MTRASRFRISFRSSALRSGNVPGFTLIEVLVVVAIIALLVAILLPSLARARFQAKVVVCKAHLKDLGSSCHMYATAFRGYFPLTANSGEDNFYSLWSARLLPNVNILIDPATKNRIRPETLKWKVDYKTGPNKDKVAFFTDPSGSGQTGDISGAAKGRDDNSGGHSYEYQGCYDGSSGDKVWPLKGAHKKVEHFLAFQSQMPLVFDNDPSLASMGPNAADGCVPSKQNNGNNCPQTWDNHGADGVDIMFGDGHVEFLKKVQGQWKDMTANSPADTSADWKQSKSAVIDQALARTQAPWNYFRR